MMSSAQDWLTGVALKEAGNLNWSATSSYYSTVHCGRLLCFVACGDFPTKHKMLRELFLEQRVGSNRPRQPIPFEFNWLKGFSRGQYDLDEPASPDNRGRQLLDSLRLLEPDRAQELTDLCPRFAALGA